MNMSKTKAQQEWSIARKFLARSRIQSLKEAAARLNDDWKSGLDAEFEKDFFLEQQSQRKFEKRRREVHDLIDDVMNKRRRKDYESEKAALDKELQNVFVDEDGVYSDDNESDNEIDLREGEGDLTLGYHTPPSKQDQAYHDEIPSAEDSEATFHYQDDTSSFKLSAEDQALYNEAASWFKSMIGRDTESAIRKLREERFREPWVHDLLYDRLKIFRTGLSAQTDENTYTSFWVAPDFVALQTGIPGLISKGFVNENHFTPSAWRRALSRGKPFAKGTNVDAYYFARDNHVDVIFENIGSPTCTNHGKHDDDKKKCYRNAADALLNRFYNSSGSFEIAKDYRIIIVVVFGHDVTIYTASIKDSNEYNVSKIFQGTYHFSKDVYLAKLLVHLKFCLTIKTIMEMNVDVSIKFGNSIESVSKEEQAHYKLKIHTTPTTCRI
ncbi:hypothetical protein BGZ79_004086 [Entomortierella chlamydospora]|nr:hypothetical protein BGZ79_004086 [Entomortierella chlamydospora]